MNQSAGPINVGSASSLQAGDIIYFMRVTLFIALLCMGYSLSRPTPAEGKDQYLLLSAATETGTREQEWSDLPSWQRKASEKAIGKYTATQEKKWRRWNEAMFERSS